MDRATAAAIAAVLGAHSSGFRAPRTAKPRKRVPTMVTASPEEIAAWNRAIEARKPLTRSKRQIERAANKVFKGTGQNPKFPKTRTHKQHKHPLRDEHGAYTLTGRNADGTRRMWTGS